MCVVFAAIIFALALAVAIMFRQEQKEKKNLVIASNSTFGRFSDSEWSIGWEIVMHKMHLEAKNV